MAPARISEAVEAEARASPCPWSRPWTLSGCWRWSLFLDKEGRILVNEVAPRAHNSGHHTIEACGTSQFEQHLRAILGLPLGDTAQRSAAAMLNLIGGPGANGVPLYTAWLRPGRTRTAPPHLRQGGGPRGPEDGPCHRVGRLSRCGRATRPRLYATTFPQFTHIELNRSASVLPSVHASVSRPVAKAPR